MSNSKRDLARHFRLGKKQNIKDNLKIILQKAVTHEQELGDLKDMFYFAEAKKLESPTLAQWQRMNDRLFLALPAKARSLALLFRQWRDWWLATDSYWKTFIACAVYAVLALAALVATYIVVQLLIEQSAAPANASASVMEISCHAASLPILFMKSFISIL